MANWIRAGLEKELDRLRGAETWPAGYLIKVEEGDDVFAPGFLQKYVARLEAELAAMNSECTAGVSPAESGTEGAEDARAALRELEEKKDDFGDLQKRAIWWGTASLAAQLLALAGIFGMLVLYLINKAG